MIKNSWGTSFGAGHTYPGCAWVAYGAANLGDWTRAISGYGNPPLEMFYHDEGGWMLWSYGSGTGTTAYGAVRFTPSQDETLTAVDFWANDVNMGYEIKIFDTLNDLGGGNYSFSSQLGTTQTGTTSEQGYYSIPLSTPVSLTSGDDFIVQVKLTTSTSGWYYPIPIDYYDAATFPWLPPWSGIASFSGESYFSSDGTQFGKPTEDVGIRARGEDTTPPEVDSTVPVADATGVAVNTVVSATFSEDIQEGVNFGDIAISGATGVSATIDGATLTIAHDDFAEDTTYEVTIPAGAVNDLADNPLAAPYTWSFTTEVPGFLSLVEGVNIIAYTGVTTDLPGALTNIGPDGEDVVDGLWARGAWTGGEWLFYNARIQAGTLSQLEAGRGYIIVVTQDCIWVLP